MQQFKLNPIGFEEIRKKALVRTIPIMLLAGAAGIYVGVSSNSNDVDDIGILPYVILIVLVS